MAWPVSDSLETETQLRDRTCLWVSHDSPHIAVAWFWRGLAVWLVDIVTGQSQTDGSVMACLVPRRNIRHQIVLHDAPRIERIC